MFIYDRAGRKCETCGREDDLTIHHLDYNGKRAKLKGCILNNDVNNLKVLCRSCHGKIHGKQSVIVRRQKREAMEKAA